MASNTLTSLLKITIRVCSVPTMTTLEEAIRQKYLYEDEFEDPEACIIFAPRRHGDHLPSTIVINNCTIEKLGNWHRIRDLCSGIRELDLAQNQILDLKEVFCLLKGTSRLSFLNLSCNDLSHLKAVPDDLACLSTLKRLVLNSTYISWDVVKEFLRKMPHLEELYLCLNNYLKVELHPCDIFSNVKLVHLSGNPITSWNEVLKIGRSFPDLEALVMVDCEIENLAYEESFVNYFNHLSTLNMNNNKLSEWDCIDKLTAFPALQDVRVLGLPLYDDFTEHERRQLLIGRLPNVIRLNGSHISDNEREDAERAFIRHYMDKDVKPPRYFELETKHGKLDPLVEVDLAPQMEVTVMLHYGELRAVRSLHLKQTVAEFKSSLQDFTGLPPTRMKVYYVDNGLAPPFLAPEVMRFNAKKLYSYCVRDGDEFIIDEK